MSVRGIAILGSTGSIGVSALEVAATFPERFEVKALAAGRNIDLLAKQIRQVSPRLVSVDREEDRARLRQLLGGDAAGVEILSGSEGVETVAVHPEASLVLTAMVGAVGLRPTLAAIRRGATVAIANKEPLVIAGQLCMAEAETHHATILPVDSEHSAIFQCLQGQRRQDVRRLVLTGSGGPLRTCKELDKVTPEQALAHPTWTMGPKITIDSATLMNKGLELIEARWLFDVPAEWIQVLIHPQSIVHSMVEFSDGSVLAQLGVPDMRIPIAFALGYPRRLELDLKPLDLTQLHQGLVFEEPDPRRFPCLKLAYQAIQSGDTYPAVLNGANEVAVEAFLRRRIGFLDIPAVIHQALDEHQPAGELELEDLLEVDRQARRVAEAAVNTKTP